MTITNQSTISRDKLALAANQQVKEREYWLNKCSERPPLSMFPDDFEQKEIEIGEIGGEEIGDRLEKEHRFTIDESLTAALLKLASGSDARLHMALAASLMTLLARYSGNRDIVIGTPIFDAGDNNDDSRLLNTALPLRAEIKADTSFKSLLTGLKSTVLEAAENQAFPIDVLFEDSLYDVAFVLENIQQVRHIQSKRIGILFVFKREDQSLNCALRYDSSRYSEETVRRLSLHFKNLSNGAVSALDSPLMKLDMLSPEERTQLLVDFNDTDMEYPRDKTIVALFEERAALHPGNIAAVWKAHRYTYRQLNEKANQLAHFLREKGVTANRVVGVLMERSLDLVVTILGVLKAGAAYLPVDPDYPEQRIRRILDSGDVSLVLTDTGAIHSLSFIRLSQSSQQESGAPVLTASRPPIQNFDDLPRPDRSLINYSRYHQNIGIAPVKRTLALQTSRGCPYNCIYCHKIWPKKHQVRSAGNIYEEILWGYDSGVRDFVFIDDIFNLDKTNSGNLLERIIKANLDIRLYYPNGLRADILDREFIDLMAAAGTVNIDVALESACPRIQTLMRKRLNIDKFRENVQYLAQTYPHIILEMEMMHGFPTETEEEALMTFDFLKSIRWVHFPNLNILKIFPNTDMYRLALEHGVSKRAIENSTNFAYHELPDTLPVPKAFTRQLQARLLEEYFLSKERMLAVLPQQMKVLSEDELIKKYDTYLPMEIRSVPDILEAAGIKPEELGTINPRKEDRGLPPDIGKLMAAHFPRQNPEPDSFRFLLLDLSQFFSSERPTKLYDVTEEPLGLMYLLSYLNKELGAGISGKIAKSGVDFDGYEELRDMLREFKPHLIGIRTLSYFREFFHRVVAMIKQWGFDVPIIAGGPYATSDYPIMLRDPDVDLAVLGEGEQTIMELVEQMKANGGKLPTQNELQRIPGIAFVPDEQKVPLREERRELMILDTLRDGINRYPASNPKPVARPGDLLYLISTSGSTGTPKSVMMTHGNLVNLIHFQQRQTEIDFSAVLQFASISFDVSFQEIFSTLLSGGAIHMLTPEIRSNIPLLLDFIRENKIKTLFLPPAFVKLVFDEPDYVEQFPKCVNHIVTAGEQLVVTSSMRDYFQASGIYLHNHYGPAETHVVTTFTMAPQDKMPALPPIGKPIANTRILILDPYGNIQPAGVAGELCVAGDAVGKGYYNNPQLTRERFTPIKRFSGGQDVLGLFFKKAPLAAGGMYNTGDLALWMPDGNIRFLGRRDHQVQVRGFRIELDDIRAQLLETERVKDAIVVDHRTGSGDVYLCAYVVPANGGGHPEEGSLRDYLFHVLPDYMVPSHFISMPRLPVNTSGKIDRKALPVPGFSSGSGGEEANLPRDAMEKALVELWSGVLDVPAGIDDNFFEMGGHSLKGTVLISRIHKEFNVKLPLVDLFKFPTVRTLAGYLRESGVTVDDAFQAIPSAPEQEVYPLSSAQKRLYILQQMDKQSTVYNIPMMVSIHGRLDSGKLEGAFKALISRHESLRTSFESRGKDAVQRIHQDVTFAMENTGPISPIGPIHNLIKPFDLTHPPLLRVVLGQLESGAYLLMLDMHHIIADAVTMGIVIRETMALYDGRELPALGLQYKDYSVWQNQRTAAGVYDEQRRFWLERLSGGLPQLDMHTDFPRAARTGSEGDGQSLLLAEPLSRSIVEKARETGVTLYQFLLAAYIVLLHKYSNQQDIIVGSPVSGRRHADLHDIVGVFVNMVSIRTRPMAEKSSREFLEEVKIAALAAHENQDYPFDDLVNHLGTGGTGERNPVFDVAFLFSALGEEPSVETSLKIEPYEAFNKVSRFDMLLGASQTPGNEILLNLEYSTNLFNASTINTFLARYRQVIAHIVKDLDQPLSSIQLLSEADRQAYLYDFNDTASPLPEDLLLHHLFESQAEKTPANTAVEDESGESLTYRELNKRAQELAIQLTSQGAAPGVIIAIKMERSIELVIAILAVLKTGAAYLPIDPALPNERIQYMLNDSGAISLSNITLPPDLQQHIKQSSRTEESPLERGAPKGRGVSHRHPAYVIYTSGSTGNPKGVLIEHRGAVNYIAWAAKTYVKDETVAFPLYTGIAFDLTVTSIFTPLSTGNTVYIYRGESHEPLIDRVIKDNKAGVVKCTPAHLKLIAPSLNSSTSNIRRFILGGEDLETQAAQAVHNAFNGGIEIYNEYGPTETVVGSMIHRFDPEVDTGPSVSIGKPIANTSIYLLDPELNPVPTGIPGEIYIGGAGVARGYLNRPELTHEKFVRSNGKRLYRTGDRAVRDESGNIRFLGRIDQQVKVRGFRVEPGEIEHHLKQYKTQKETPSILQEAIPRPEDLATVQRCSRCLMSVNQPGIQFDNEGVCSVCREYESYEGHVKNYFKTPGHLERLFEANKRPDAKYDVLLLFSGGKDSTYALYKLMDLGLRVLTFTFDNGYISTAAFDNIHRTTRALNVHHINGTAQNMKKVFVESLRSNHSVCHGCWHAINTYGVQVAHEHGINMVVSGLSRGQIFEMRLHPLFQTGVYDEKEIEDKLLLFRKGFHAHDNKFSRILSTGLENDVVETVRFVDFFRYVDTPVEEIKHYLDHKGWVQPRDTGFCSSNCKINDTGIYMHLKTRNTHFYEAPLSWDVRMGQMSREAGLKETGFRPEPRRVDRVLREIGYYEGARVEDAVVLDKTDANGNSYLSAYVVASGALNASDLRRFLAQRLPDYMIPSQFYLVDSIPLTVGGKVDRKALAEAESPGRRLSGAAKYVAPSDEKEHAMAGFFKDILETERVGVEDNFFEIGATSFEIVQAANHFSKEFQRDIPVIKLFEFPTIASFLDFFNSQGESGEEQETQRQAKQEKTMEKGKSRFAQRRKMRKQERVQNDR